jgi:hypothetical protein
MPVGVSAYVALANVTLGSSASTVTFSSISQAYRDLVIVFSGRGTAGFVGRFNGDTGSNYSVVTMAGNGSTTESTSVTSTSLFFANGTTNPLNGTTQAQVILNFLDYSATDKHKTVLTRADRSDAIALASAGRWANTAAITQIEIRTNFIAGDSFALYGIAS